MQILSAFRSEIQNAGITTPNNVAVAVEPEPWPIGGGPAIFVMPGRTKAREPTDMGAGRYYYLVEGQVTVRVVDRSFRDVAYADTSRLTDAAYGLLNTVHSVIKATHLKFLIDSTGQPLAQEPLLAIDQTPPKTYTRRNGAGEWAYVDLIYDVTYQAHCYPVVDIPATGPVTACSLSDVLKAILAIIQSLEIFNSNQTFISLYPGPYPLSGPPFCVLAPGKFGDVEKDVVGAGADYSTAEGSVIITLVQANRMDVVDRSDQMMTNPVPAYGLLARLAALVDRLQLTMPLRDDGVPVTVQPIRLGLVDAPKYYDKAMSLASISTAWVVRYQQELS
jgi:hypothetical protein